MRMHPHMLHPRDEGAVAGARLHRSGVRRVWDFARPYRRSIYGFLAAIVASALLSLVAPFAFRRIIDYSIPNGDRRGITILAGVVVAAAVFDAALSEVRRLAPALTTLEGKHAAATLLGPQGTEAWQLHGVGLDDAEGLPEVLRPGMAVAYELMFTADGDGFYLEDMILVKSDGYELLTQGLPYTAQEIETAMSPGSMRRD